MDRGREAASKEPERRCVRVSVVGREVFRRKIGF